MAALAFTVREALFLDLSASPSPARLYQSNAPRSKRKVEKTRIGGDGSLLGSASLLGGGSLVVGITFELMGLLVDALGWRSLAGGSSSLFVTLLDAEPGA